MIGIANDSIKSFIEVGNFFVEWVFLKRSHSQIAFQFGRLNEMKLTGRQFNEPV